MWGQWSNGVFQMQIESISGLLGNLLQKGFLLLLNFIDDIAIFALTRLGFHWYWLQWLSTGLLIITLLYWGLRLWRTCRQLQLSHTGH